MQTINDLWKTTIGKLAIVGGGGIAGLMSLCFVCTVCGALVGLNDTVQNGAKPTEIVVKALPIQIAEAWTTATPTQPILTNTPTLLPPTETPVPTATEVPPTTETPVPTATEVPPREIPQSEVLEPTILAGDSNINLRGGPGTEYETVGVLSAGDSIKIVGRNADSSWWQVATPEGLAWVAASVVTANHTNDNIPVVEPPPPPIPTEPLPTEAPITEVSPTEPAATEQPSVETCDCSGDLYNCKGDFGTHTEAQACYEYCISIGRGDVHGLDRDKDGTACDPTSWD